MNSRRSTGYAMIFALAAAACIGAAARAAGGAGDCESRWMPGFGESIAGVDGKVEAVIVWDPDGAGPQPPLLVIGGSFSAAGSVAASNIAAWNSATGSWQALGAKGPGPGIPGTDGPVRALAVYQGELIAGGKFFTAGDVAVGSISRFNGSTWQPIGAPGPTNGIYSNGDFSGVWSLHVHNSALIVGGNFKFVGGLPVSGLASWNGSDWQPLHIESGGGLILALATFDGDLIAAGSILTLNGMSMNHIARFNGTSWLPLGDGLDSIATSLALYGGQLIVGGLFTAAGGVPCGHIARWNGRNWQTLGSPGPDNGVGGVSQPFVLSLAVHQGELVVGGRFLKAGGLVADNIARWNGTWWSPLGAGVSDDVDALVSVGGALAAGGKFQTAGAMTANGLATWSAADGWLPLLSEYFDQSVRALHAGDSLAIGGSFTPTSGVNALRIAQWDGSSFSSYGDAAAGLGGDVLALTTYDGAIVAGGQFSISGGGGGAGNGVARWDLSTQQWLAVGGGVSTFVHALAVYPPENGDLIAGGHFLAAGDPPVAANRIARFDGAQWHSMGSGMGGMGAATRVFALTVYNGDLIAGGNFTTAGGAAAAHIARWDGEEWHPIGTGMDGPVHALTVFNGDLIAGGSFMNAGGNTARHIARYNAVSGQWADLDIGMSHDVRALAIYNGDLIAGGFFLGAGSVSANRIARWSDAAGDWQPLGEGLDGNVLALTAFHNELIAGGEFLYAGGKPSARFARWTDTNEPWFAQQPVHASAVCGDDVSFAALAAFGYDVMYQWRKGGIAIANGATAHGSTIAGASSPNLSIANMQPADAGTYDAVIVGACGVAVSDSATLTYDTLPCPADLTGDGAVGVADLLYLLAHWGPCGLAGGCACALADLTHSGSVGVADLLALLAAWGPCAGP